MKIIVPYYKKETLKGEPENNCINNVYLGIYVCIHIVYDPN